MIQRIFEIAGWQDATFHQAGNGKEALDLLQTEEMDLIMSDYNMPEMDGAQFLNALRSDAKFAKLPVIMITSIGNEAREKQLLEAGANAVLPKPVSPPQLSETLVSLFGEVNGG